MTNVVLDRIRYLGWFALWTTGMALSVPAMHDPVLRVLITFLFTIGMFVVPQKPGDVPLYDRNLTWRDAASWVVVVLSVVLLFVAANASSTRDVVAGFGDWIMRNWAWCAVVLWLLGSAFRARQWYRSERCASPSISLKTMT